MAAADPLPAKSLPIDKIDTSGHSLVKSSKPKQKNYPVDAALLSSKLDVLTREQQAAQLRREKRNATRNGSYVPRSAAKSFTATATPLDRVTSLSKHPAKRQSVPSLAARDSLVTEGRVLIPAWQREVALKTGIEQSEKEPAPESEAPLSAKPQRSRSLRDTQSDPRKLDEQFAVKHARSEPSEHETEPTAQEKLPLPLIDEDPAGESTQQLLPTSISEGSRKVSTTSPPEPEIHELIVPMPVEHVLARSRGVSPLRDHELALAQGNERWPSINQDEQETIETAMRNIEISGKDQGSRDMGLSLLEALNMDFELPDEGDKLFDWNRHDPFKPEVQKVPRTEKRSVSRLHSKRDSMNPMQAEDIQTKEKETTTQTAPRRRRSSPRKDSKDPTIVDHSAQERGRQVYRPGDAAKRRTAGSHSSAPWPAPRTAAKNELRPLSFHAITESRLSRFLEDEVAIDAAIPEDEEQSAVQHRPKLVARDRPNWSQASQSGDDFRHTLNLFPRSSKKTDRRPTNLAPVPEPPSQPAKKYSGPQNDHLVADAVKIIQKQQKGKLRRESVMGFLKRL